MEHKIRIKEEAARCLLCNDAPCTKVCVRGLDPARGLRAIKFDNLECAGLYFSNEGCSGCDAPCEKGCIHYDFPIRIKDVAGQVAKREDRPKADLSIDFCGIHCENPFFLASSAICTNYEMVANAFEMGWGGVVYKTICLEEINEVSPRFDSVEDEKGEFWGFRNMEQLSENPPEVDFDILKRLKQNYPNKIVIASIMGKSEEEWVKLAKTAEAAGVDAVELNYSCPQMKYAGMGSDVGQNSELVTIYTHFVKQAVKIPVIPKMTPNITNIMTPAQAAYFSGADAVAAINTIKSVTMSNDSAVSGKKTTSGYSGKAIKPIALRHVLDITKHPLLKGLQVSGIGGIETWRDALEFLQLGCNNTQICTAVMQYGYRIIDDLKDGLSNYMQTHNIAHLSDIVGSELPSFVRADYLDRDTFVMPTVDREKCLGCGRCYISCRDGGHQAIEFDEERKPHILGKKCVGCHLCRLVCPSGAIGIARRVNKRKN